MLKIKYGKGLCLQYGLTLTETYNFMGYFSIIKQTGDGNCVYYTLAGIQMPQTLEYERDNGTPIKHDELLIVQNQADERRKFTADCIDKYDAAGIKDEKIETMLVDAMHYYKLSTRSATLERIRRVTSILVNKYYRNQVGAVNLTFTFTPRRIIVICIYLQNVTAI